MINLNKFVPMDMERPTVTDRLSALSSVDGRYGNKTWELREFCSEAGLQRLRTAIEIEWLLFLRHFNFSKLPELLQENSIAELRNLYRNFTLDEAVQIKEFEKATNHDVKSVEYLVAKKLEMMGLGTVRSFVHILLTSEDVTNAAYALIIKQVRKRLIYHLRVLLTQIEECGKKWKAIPMLAHTHGQPATPTTVGKEFINFASRTREAITTLKDLPIKVKWNGATGNFNAHRITYPNRDWQNLSNCFARDWLGFEPLSFTAQTNNYAYLANILHQIKDICSIMIDFTRDMWLYISFDYLKQRPKEGEVGSSTMPHKVNPIDFENAEGNFELSEVNFGFLASKLQKTRLQRDLSDSTVLRNLGTFFGWFLIGVKSTIRGLSKIEINEVKLKDDLKKNPTVIAEAIQSVLRKHGVTDAYEQLKELTRGQVASLKGLKQFVSLSSQLPPDAISRLRELLPKDYIGDATILVDDYFKKV